MSSKCTAIPGKIKAVILVERPSKYMVKKYGYTRAYEMQLEKFFKKYSKK